MGNPSVNFYPDQQDRPCQKCRFFGGFGLHLKSRYVRCGSPHGSGDFYSDPAKGCRLWELASLAQLLERSLDELQGAPVAENRP